MSLRIGPKDGQYRYVSGESGSCFYRAINVADEGAALCRSPGSVFNMPAAGRAVATVGEIALVVQISEYISDTARRLACRPTPRRTRGAPGRRCRS